MTKKPGPNVASVHRFGDTVAVYVGNGGTTYLTAAQAVQLGAALYDCALSVESVKFTASNFATVEIVRELS